MNQVLTPQDWIKLSAYLDGQLSEAEREEVDRFCAAYPNWQAALKALEHTRILLRSAPKRSAPRNFTISSAVANTIRKPARGILTLRWVNVFSSAIAMLLLVFGFVLNNAPALKTAAPAAPAMMAAESVNTESEPTLPPIIIWGAPGTIPQGYADKGYYGGYGGGGAGGSGLTGMGGGGGGGAMDTAPMPAAVAPEANAAPPAPPAAEANTPPQADQTAPLNLPANGPILGLNEQPKTIESGAPREATPSPTSTPLLERPLILIGLIVAVGAVITGFFAWRKSAE